MDLRTGSIRQHIWKIAFPASVGFFFQTMYNVVDTFFAGQISTQAVAALTISFPVFFLIVVIAEGLSIGSTAIISNALGESDYDKVMRYSSQTISYGAFCAIVLMLLGWTVSEPIFRHLGAEGLYLDYALIYIHTTFLGSIFFVGLTSFNAILVAYGNSWVRRNAQVAGFFLNCLLVPWFMFGGLGLPAMGFQGIALATILVVGLTVLYMGSYVISEGYLRGCTWRNFIPDISAFKELFIQSFPASFNLMTITLGFLVIMHFVKDFGQAAMAAYGITMRIEQLVLLPTVGLIIATITIVGQNNGAKQFDRIHETINKALKAGALIVACGALVMFLFPKQLIEPFSRDPSVLKFGTDYLVVAACISWAYMICSLTIAALQGMKRPFYALIIGLLRQVIIPLPLFYLIISVWKWDLLMMWWGLALVTWSAAIFSYFYVMWIIKREKLNNTLID